MPPLDFKMACDYIPCSDSKLKSMLRKGELDGYYYKVGDRYYFRSEKLDEWKDKGGTNQKIKEC